MRLMPPHRIVGKHDNVAFADWDIYYRRPIGKLRATCEHAAHEQVTLLRRKSKDNSRQHRNRCLRSLLAKTATAASTR